MSPSYVGGVSARLTGPHVYFIRLHNLLYIGETQKHPVIRWSEHLGQQGSFRMAVVGRGQSVMDAGDRVSFHAYDVSELAATVPRVQVKQATQAVEHELHVLLRSRPSLLGGSFRIISDTDKTAPRTFRYWALARTFAEEIAAELATALTGVSGTGHANGNDTG